MTHPRFSDFTKNKTVGNGEKMSINDVLNQEILILGYEWKDSKFKENAQYIIITFELNGKKNFLTTSSQIIIEQMETIVENTPFYTIIKRKNNYYTLT